MSKPPFLISSRTGSELWQNTIQLPPVRRTVITSRGLSADDIQQAEQLALREVEAAAGKLKQYFLSQRQSSDSGIAKWAKHVTKVGNYITVTYTRNHSLEALQVDVDANGLLQKQPQYIEVKPLLVSKGWVVESTEGFADSDSALKINDPKYLRINFEDAVSCGGANDNNQKCIVTQQLTAVHGDWKIELTDYDGQVEWQDLGFDILRLSYTINGNDSKQLLDGDSRDLDRGCEMGDPEYTTYPENEHIFLRQGEQLEFRVIADTIDSRYHLGAYYELKFNWYPMTSSQLVLVTPE